MRFLFLSNFYPPSALGGYELLCREVAVELGRRGHRVDVLTSRAASSASVSHASGVTVHRSLRLEVDRGLVDTVWRLLARRRRIEADDLDGLRRLIAATGPDAALIWGMWNVPRSVPAAVEEILPARVAYYLADYWPALPSAYLQRWEEPARRPAAARAKRVLARFFGPRLAAERRVELQLAHPCCISAALREGLVTRGVDVGHALVVHPGVLLDRFAATLPAGDGTEMRLVALGRIVPDKGIHTILEALHLVSDRVPGVHLDVLGRGDPDYEARLRTIIAARGLQEKVSFLGWVEPNDVVATLSRCNVLVLASEWEEPLGIAVLEAMAAGLAVVGSGRGGMGEVLRDGETGLEFPAGDAQALAKCLLRLASDGALRRRLAAAGRRRVQEQFSLGRTVDQLEAVLVRLATERTPPSSVHEAK